MNGFRRLAAGVLLMSAALVSTWRAASESGGSTQVATPRSPRASPRPPHAKASTEPGPPLRIAVISDLNGAYGSRVYGKDVHEAVRVLATSVRPDIVLVTGDMVAGQQPRLRYAEMWQSFHAAVTTPLAEAGILVAPAPGNHDAATDPGFAKERAEYKRQWQAPGRIPAVRFIDRAGYPLRYSFTLGGVRFVALDATRPGPLGRDQRQWVEAQLAGAPEKVKIAYGHLPLHPVARGRVREVLGDSELETACARQGLTAYLSGHHHAYYPGLAGGFLQVAVPCLGDAPRPLVGTSGRSSPKAFVVLEIEGDRLVRLDAWEAPTFTRSIELERLPRRIVHGRHSLLRADGVGARLAEQAGRPLERATSGASVLDQGVVATRE